MYEQDTVENREAIIKEMTDQLEKEDIGQAEILYFKEFASKQPYDRLHRDSIMFWNMRF